MERGGRRGGKRREEEVREENREAGSTLMGKLPQAAPDTQPSGKNRVNKTGVKRKEEMEIGGVFVSTQSVLGRCEGREGEKKQERNH